MRPVQLQHRAETRHRRAGPAYSARRGEQTDPGAAGQRATREDEWQFAIPGVAANSTAVYVASAGAASATPHCPAVPIGGSGLRVRPNTPRSGSSAVASAIAAVGEAVKPTLGELADRQGNWIIRPGDGLLD